MENKIRDNKIFCTGLSRTGTSSLHIALLALGISSLHYPGQRCLSWLNGSYGPETTKRFAAYSDIPTPCFFKQLHKTHPNAYFIHTTRDVEKWADSVEKHIANGLPSSDKTILRDFIRLSAYGVINFERTKFIDAFYRHEESISSYFAYEKTHFLQIDLERKDMGWEKICRFLGLEPPTSRIGFPKIRTPNIGRWSAVDYQHIDKESVEIRRQLTR